MGKQFCLTHAPVRTHPITETSATVNQTNLFTLQWAVPRIGHSDNWLTDCTPVIQGCLEASMVEGLLGFRGCRQHRKRNCFSERSSHRTEQHLVVPWLLLVLSFTTTIVHRKLRRGVKLKNRSFTQRKTQGPRTQLSSRPLTYPACPGLGSNPQHHPTKAHNKTRTSLLPNAEIIGMGH